MDPFQPKPPTGHRPYLVAHRGISGKAPENTLAAFQLACETPGIDMIELDVRLSGDDQVIVLHDRTLQRTTTGNGSARLYSVAQLKEFDAGSWFNPAFAEERIPTLDEVLKIVNKRRWINIELKSDFFFRGQQGLLERGVLDVVRRAGCEHSVMYSSFNHRMVATIKKLEPKATTGVIFSFVRDYGRLPSKLAGRVCAEVFVCEKREISPRVMQDARQAGVAVYVNTLNSVENAEKMMEIGIDGILSDSADEIVHSVKKPGV